LTIPIAIVPRSITDLWIGGSMTNSTYTWLASFSQVAFPTVRDPLETVLTASALDALTARIEATVDRRLNQVLARTIASATSSPWLNTKQAAAYLGISENALRLRVREHLVPAHRDGAGRLRFHRRDLDGTMTPEAPRRRQR
jgi:excisionase family DNA binding protein